MAKEDRV